MSVFPEEESKAVEAVELLALVEAWREIAELRSVIRSRGLDFKKKMPRTARQAELLGYVISFREAKGHEPSYGQIARHMGLRSRATVHKHVRALERRGLWPVTEQPST